MKLSIIIPAFNEAKTIERVFDRLKESVGDFHEIIVVDDASTDGTADLVRSLPTPSLASGFYATHITSEKPALSVPASLRSEGISWSFKTPIWNTIRQISPI